MRHRSGRLGATSEKYNCRSGVFEKKYRISKKNHSNWSPDEGDIADLKSARFLEILGDGGRVETQIWNFSA